MSRVVDTVAVMRLEATGRNEHEVVELYRDDLGECACGVPFDRRGVSRGYLRCSCGGSGAHRTFRCPACKQTGCDPPHIGLAEPVGSDYFGG